MKNNFSTALLLTTYNWPEALRLVLLSIKRQSIMPNEILIADDGSTNETKNVIDSFRDQIPVNITHFWHEDEGFRKSIILNKAIAESDSDYIIQIDGDCIIHKNFIEDHKKLASKNTYLFGSRVNIQKEYLTVLFQNDVIDFKLFSKGIKKRTRTLHIPLFSRFFKRRSDLPDKFRGCNTSFWKSDIVAVNGYNEDFKGWGREDSELIVRLINNHVAGKRIRYRGILYHIFHDENSRENLYVNNTIQQNSIVNNSFWCKNGIDKYLM